MKNLKKFENFNEEKLTIQQIIEKYVKEYSEHKEFFLDFISRFPTKEDWTLTLVDYCASNDDDFDNEYDDEERDYSVTNDYILDKCWNAETEVYLLEKEVGNFPGGDIWIDFYNDMEDAWEYSSDVDKYNL